ncbi:tRNA-dihydrouridine synthase 2 [Coniosporium apollinis CBS 100218]|uniref:tRNA-dihydrouridine synthase 2 n=1 Tax=Coniosporium apollinis (strain CBS 100218) TaxID=1168221 RepID=R7YJM9_CONA1|nr:tRNA-dihydrouridine synthase 2 [Coniosporium apollinis CBS 100218]EON62112.1 tRNA-dihydrouridine synthase 2 [Coniosporium apollinis CBS 100218]
MTSSPPRIPIPKNGVDYRGKVVLAPMVRSGELPSRLLALKYGADLVWGPETIDRALIGTTRRENPMTNTIDFTRPSSNGLKNSAHNPDQRESVIYRLHPTQEHKKLIFQIGTANPETAVQAAKLVAADVAGIDVNSGCPKPFSTSGGMGAALLRTPDTLCRILEALVKEVGEPHEIGISVKIRLLETPEKTEALVRRLVKTGITGLTVHCRTTPMRPRERAIREQLKMIAGVCREAGVACVMNGDVENREQAVQLMQEYGCDGAMIATAAERNSSVFRAKEDGGRAGWKELVREYMQFALEVENRWGNTKFLLSQMIPGKEASYMRMNQSKGYEQLIEALGFEDLRDLAKDVDDRLGLNNRVDKPTKRANAREENKRKQMEEAGEDSQTKKIRVPPAALNKPLESIVVPDAAAEVAPGTALSI